MPAPLDWSAVGGLESVRLLVEQVGAAETARRLSLSHSHGVTLRQISRRRGWEPPRQARQAPAAPVTDGPVTVSRALSLRPAAVSPSVTPASEALSAVLADDSRVTRLSLSRAARRMASEAEDAPLEAAGLALQAGKLAALTHGWAQAGEGGQGVVINLALMGLSLTERED